MMPLPSDTIRLASMLGWGGFLGLFFPWWYRYLELWFDRFAVRLVVHQGIVSPVFNFVFLCYCEATKSLLDLLSRMRQRVQSDWLYLTCRSFPFWICMNGLNFWIVPMAWRALTMNSLNCGWTVFLSWVGHRELAYDGGSKV